MTREQFEEIERHLCDSYKALDRLTGKTDAANAQEFRKLSEQCLALYNQYCDAALPLLDDDDRAELADTRQRTHLLDS